MSKPANLPVFDTNLTNTTTTPSAQMTDGFPHASTLPSGVLNYLLNLIYQWILWLFSSVATWTRTEILIPLHLDGSWTVNVLAGTSLGYNCSTGSAGSAVLALPTPTGYKLASVSMTAEAASSALQVVVEQLNTTVASGGSPTAIGSFTPTLSGSIISFTMNFLAKSAVQSFTAAAGGIYTRTTGSFVTDGFFVGQIVSWTGFVNSANNVTNATITAVSATSMTVSITGQVSETSATAQCSGVSPTTDGTYSLAVVLTSAGGVAIRVSPISYSYVPQ